MSKDARWYQLLFTILLSLSLLHCSRNDNRPNGNSTSNSPGLWSNDDAAADGTQHGGGGDVKDSTPDQVNRAIDMAIKMANESNIPRNVLANFFADSQDPIIMKGSDLIYPNRKVVLGLRPMEWAYESKVLSAFLKNQIDRIPKGDCPHPPDETTADASVSEHNINAKICFSVGNLTEIPASTILREVLGLVVHEACHMAGCKEPEAKYWQEAFVAYFAGRFGDIEIDDFSERARTGINVASQFLIQATSFAEHEPNSRYVYAGMGSVIANLVASPYTDDPIAIQLKARPKFPEFIDPYWIQINTIIQKSQVAFQPPHPAYIFPLLDNGYPGKLVDENDVMPKLKEIRADLNCLSETLDALNTGKLRRECYPKALSSFERAMFLPRNGGDKKNPFENNPKYAEK